MTISYEEIKMYLFISALTFASVVLIYNTHLKNSAKFGRGYLAIIVLAFGGGAFLSSVMLGAGFPDYLLFGVLSVVIGGASENIWTSILEVIDFFKKHGLNGGDHDELS